MKPKTLKEFQEYLQQELDYGWTERTEWHNGFDACLIRYIEKISEFIGEEPFKPKEETCPECDGKGCDNCTFLKPSEL
jgi:hypothetical protein